jgi:type II secretory pathway component PulK
VERFLKLFSFKMPKTLWGFPVEDEGVSTAESRHTQSKRGIALIMAIMIISIMMLFSTDLILTSQVNMTLATAKRDALKEEYLAKSGFNAALLLLSADFAVDLFMAQQDPKAGLSDGLGDMWAALNGLPIGGETAELMMGFQEEFGLNAVLDSGVMDQLKLFEGSFTLNVQDEAGKINVNDCFNSRCQEGLLMLEALFSCPAEKTFLDQKKLSGRELAYRIKDYIDKDSRADEASGFNDEDEPFAKRFPKQAAKNAPLDSVDELRMIEGWDEEVHAVFSPYITAFPFAVGSTDRKFQMNVNTTSRAMLQCLFPEAKGDCSEKSALALKKRQDLGQTLGSGEMKIADILRETLCYTGGDGNPGEANNKANWFTKYSMVFRIEVTGELGGNTKKLTAVVERIMPDPKKNEKAAYRVLFFKIT